MSAYRSASFPWYPLSTLEAAREEASLILTETEAALDPVAGIEGFLLACLVDTSTGMVLAARKDQDDISLPTVAATAPIENSTSGGTPLATQKAPVQSIPRSSPALLPVSPAAVSAVELMCTPCESQRIAPPRTR